MTAKQQRRAGGPDTAAATADGGSECGQKIKEASSDAAKGVDLAEFIHAAMEYPNVWKTEPISLAPEKWLASWSIIRVVSSSYSLDNFGLHFVGRNVREGDGAVSSKIEKFDPNTMSGVTRSGRVYRLLGLPGFDPDADYVLTHWLDANRAKAENATDELIERYGISLEYIERLST